MFDLTQADRQAAARYSEWQCRDVKIVGDYAYVAAANQTLYTLDVSNPSNLKELGSVNLGSYVDDVDVSGSFAYLTGNVGNLYIVDTSAMTSPVVVSSASGLVHTKDIFVDGSYAYLASSYIVNISDPQNPVREDSVIVGSAVHVLGDRLYAASGSQNEGLVIYDLSQPEAPLELGRHETAGAVLDVMRSGDRLYVADNLAGIRAFDISNPDRPIQIGTTDMGYAERIAWVDGHLLAAGNGLHVLDAASLEEVSPPVSDAANDVLVNEPQTYAYLATESGLEIIDISEPTSIEVVGKYSDLAVKSVAIYGQYAFCASGDNGLHVVDVTNPYSPTFVSDFEMNYASSVAVDGDLAYVVGSGAVKVLDISIIDKPKEIQSYTLANAQEVALYGDFAYVNITRGDLIVIDVSDPTIPKHVGSYPTANYGWAGTPHANVRVIDGYVYLADSFSGFYILGRCGSEFLCVSGNVRDDGGESVSGVTISSGTGHHASTGPTGAYTITNLITGTHTITPTLADWRFAPSRHIVEVPPSREEVNFYIRPLTPTGFLDLPVAYSPDPFSRAAQSTLSGGLLNSWLDHEKPIYVTDGYIRLYTGDRRQDPEPPREECQLGYNCYDGHNGIDLQHDHSLADEPVYSAGTGVVREVNRDWPTTKGIRGSRYGNYVLVDHNNGYASFYAHLASVNPLVVRDKPITDTEAITLGIMGGTGKWPVHLHFHVYYDKNGDHKWGDNTEVVDPYRWEGDYEDTWDVVSHYLWRHSLTSPAEIDTDGGEGMSPSGRFMIQVPPFYFASAVRLVVGDASPVSMPTDPYRLAANSFSAAVDPLSGGAVLEQYKTSVVDDLSSLTYTIAYSDTDFLHCISTRSETFAFRRIALARRMR